MKFPPVARGPVALSLLSLAFLARCGAAGDQGTKAVTTESNTPGSGQGGSGGISPDDPVIIDSCEGPNCDLSGGPLVAPPGCGDGTRTDDEACDDGNRDAGDGCADHCLLTEPGFSCATPGRPCVQIARCGDGIVAASEQCDDGNVAAGDGCSARCRVELGKKCSGTPSVCVEEVCGNNDIQGAEACDDGNTIPFDGCSSVCLKEPDCRGASCVSECGDGLLINEDCDDGNLIDGDGCSSTCTRETGFECVSQAACDLVAGQCVVRASAIFRDFSDSHPDFGNNAACTDLATGALQATLDANRRPVLNPTGAADACMSNQQNFSQWYTNGAGGNVPLVGEILLFDNDDGGYVNRFGANGEPFLGIDDTGGEQRGYSATLAGCQQVCANEAANETQCFNECNPFQQDVQQTQNLLNQRTNDLNQAIAQDNAVQIANLTVVVADLEAQLEADQADLADCQATCQADTAAIADACSATCAPCQNNAAQFCSGGEVLFSDGSPLFFPVDSITGPTASPNLARIPDQYGWNGFPFEDDLFPGRPAASYQHNFFFTTEVQYWFKYEADTLATLTFLGDDDVWVFVNGRLAVDLGGIHVPSTGTLTINAVAGTVNATMQDGRGYPEYTAAPINRPGTIAQFGLEPGNVYPISIFHAERQVDGSSFQLTLAGFEAAPSVCTAQCDDGILSFGEECDDGVNDGGYGECAPGCVLGPFCGDGIIQPDFGENCDVGPIGDAVCRGCREIRIY